MTPNDLQSWASRHGITEAAILELIQLLATAPEAARTDLDPCSEAGVQSAVRLRASEWGGRLWRNNVGVLFDAEGVPLRFGLANTSKRENTLLKSSDLIGLVPYRGNGELRALFTAIECKPAGWVYKGSKREEAQLRFIKLVQVAGGIAGFATCVEDFDRMVMG